MSNEDLQHKKQSGISVTRQLTVQNTALAQFDLLPDSAFVRLPVVLGLFSCSKATAWRWVKQQILPNPVKRGGITAWNVGELRDALANRAK